MTPELLRSLASKYDALAELRRKKARGEPDPDRETWRAIASSHPGALKELELLELTELDARRDALRNAADGAGAVEPWMRWVAAYHALLREAQLQRSGSGDAALEPSVAEERAAAASMRAGFAISGALFANLASPPAGRVLPVVVAAIAALHGAPEHEVARAVGVRRPSKSSPRVR